MNYCPKCGTSVSSTARYCSNCGCALSSSEPVAYLADLADEPADRDDGYRVILFSRGTCSLKNTREVLSDLLGYTSSTVSDLLDNAPVEIADELTEIQAVTIAQALAEYGMEVTIVDEDNRYIDFSDKATDSVFDSAGSLIASALGVFAGLTAANRVHRYRKYKRPSLLSLLFKPKYKKSPPVHVRRKISRDPEPVRRIEVRREAPKKPVQQRPAQNKPAQQQRPSVNTGKPSGKGKGPQRGH